MIGQVVSLGLGSPASIPVFVLVGLSPTGVVVVPPIDLCRTGVASLVAERTVLAMTPRRHAVSLVPTRTTRKDCCS